MHETSDALQRRHRERGQRLVGWMGSKQARSNKPGWQRISLQEALVSLERRQCCKLAKHITTFNARRNLLMALQEQIDLGQEAVRDRTRSQVFFQLAIVTIGETAKLQAR